MDRREWKAFLWSKRTWGVIALGSAEIARALFPDSVPDLSLLIRSIFGG